jgi:hypothetical protein
MVEEKIGKDARSKNIQAIELLIENLIILNINPIEANHRQSCKMI